MFSKTRFSALPCRKALSAPASTSFCRPPMTIRAPWSGAATRKSSNGWRAWLSRAWPSKASAGPSTGRIKPRSNKADTPLLDDWQVIANICGHSFNDFVSAGATLPLTTAEIEHFRRNHRGTESHVSRDFLTARTRSALAALGTLRPLPASRTHRCGSHVVHRAGDGFDPRRAHHGRSARDRRLRQRP